MSEITERVRSVVAKNLNLDWWIVTPNATLDRLGADSLDAIGLIMAVERELGFCLPQDVFDSIELKNGEWTFGAFVRAIENSAAHAPASFQARCPVASSETISAWPD